nr:MAG TPA: hypothetical protein [Caudoviricetes sp.]
MWWRGLECDYSRVNWVLRWLASELLDTQDGSCKAYCRFVQRIEPRLKRSSGGFEETDE